MRKRKMFAVALAAAGFGASAAETDLAWRNDASGRVVPAATTTPSAATTAVNKIVHFPVRTTDSDHSIVEKHGIHTIKNRSIITCNIKTIFIRILVLV